MNSTDILNYEHGFQEGYEQGFKDCHAENESGRKGAYNAGYSIGYDAGVADEQKTETLYAKSLREENEELQEECEKLHYRLVEKNILTPFWVSLATFLLGGLLGYLFGVL